jgi:hypothetical protein
MSEKSLGPDPKPGGDKRFEKLREALIDHSEREQRSLSVDTSSCISLVRLRDLALEAGRTTSCEVEHLDTCRRCTVLLRSMQSELGTEPEQAFEAALAAIPEPVSAQTPANAHVKSRAGSLFARLHGHGGEPERAHTLMWHAHDLARALRHYHCTGTHVEVASVTTVLGLAVRTAVRDPLTPWAKCFDYAWPLQVMLVDAAAEAAAHGARGPGSFSELYAGTVRDAPVPLKAVLIYGLCGLSKRGSHFQSMATDIAVRVADGGHPDARGILAMLVETNELHVAQRERWDALVEDAQPYIVPFLSAAAGERQKLHDALVDDTTPDGIASTVHKSIVEAAEELFQERDAVAATLRLLAARYFIRAAMEQLRFVSQQLAGATFGNVIPVVVRRALRKRGRLFLAIELAAQAGALPAVVRAMADLLEHEDPALRQALFVYFVDALTRHNPAGAAPRFAGEGAEWIFEGGALHPLRIFGDRAAGLARHDPALRPFLEWSNARIEGVLCAEELEEPAGV